MPSTYEIVSKIVLAHFKRLEYSKINNRGACEGRLRTEATVRTRDLIWIMPT